MKEYRVWAPRAEQSVELLVWPSEDDWNFDVPLASKSETEWDPERAARIDLKADEGGWFETQEAPLQHGRRYALSLDGRPPLPDPRSRFQPDGVHAPSCFVEVERLHSTGDEFRQVPWGAAVVYELHIGTFTKEGTFASAIPRLDHLVELGITHVEIMPVAAFPGNRGWGYDGVHLFAPHIAYGGPFGLSSFVRACHQRGLAVLLDVVYNHLGPSGNYLGQYGPYFSSRYNTPWGEAVNLDSAGSPEARRFFIDNALSWLRDYRIDGLRLDAVHEIYDSSAVHFLKQLTDEVAVLGREQRRPLVLVAESAANDPRLVRGPELGGYGLSAQWSDDFHHSVHAATTGETTGYYEDFGGLSPVAEAIEHGFVYRGQYSRHRDCFYGDATTGLFGQQFVVFSQNHDQIGNRAQGDRLSALTSVGLCKVAAALTLLSPYVPLLFMGEEWGTRRPFRYFTDHTDTDLAKAVSEGRKSEFGSFGWDPSDIPDPQSLSTFERSTLDWNEPLREPGSDMLSFYRKLLELRRKYCAALGVAEPGAARCSYDEQRGELLVFRTPLFIVCNFSESETTIDGARLELSEDGACPRLLLASSSEIRVASGALFLPGHAVAVLGS